VAATWRNRQPAAQRHGVRCRNARQLSGISSSSIKRHGSKRRKRLAAAMGMKK